MVVTGSRINATGFTAPTPTTMVNAEDLQKSAQPNIFSAITKLPSLHGLDRRHDRNEQHVERHAGPELLRAAWPRAPFAR